MTVVGLFVHTWHDLVPPAERGVQGEGSYRQGGWWWWGRPAFGDGDLAKYTWKNRDMVAYHVDNFIKLGVDFVFLDFTNGTQAAVLEGAHALCAELARRRGAPKVAFWIQSIQHAPLFDDQFYKRYPGVMFQWRGKPLLMLKGVEGWAAQPGRVRPLPPDLTGRFTVRWCWGLLGGASDTMWTFKETSTTTKPYVHDGVAEQMGLAFATQETYMTEGGRKCRNGGAFFKAQLTNAMKHKPRLVTITGYNEWMAINLGTGAAPRFVDLFGAECSHDIEPMKGGHGAAYFEQARQAVARLKKR